MENSIKINLFDNFEILKGNEKILESLSNTRKTKLFLAYLMINRERVVTHKELFELLWSGQEYSNPGTALRTLLYRYRTLISESEYTELYESILSKRGAYQWNPDIKVSIDIYDFEDYSNIGLNEAISKDKRIDCLKKAIDLYRGPLLSEFSEEHWAVPKAVHYRDLYIMDINAYISYLKEEGKNTEVVDVLNKAIEIAGHDDLLDVELSIAKNGFGDDMKEKKYHIMLDHMGSMSDEIDKLQRSMESDDIADSAFVCDFETFKDVYHLQRRLLARTGETMYVSLLTVGFADNFEPDSLDIERAMKALLDSTKKSLRCGDSICRYSDLCLAIMFPAGAYDDARKIMDRIRSRFLIHESNSDIVISYRIRPLKNVKE